MIATFEGYECAASTRARRPTCPAYRVHAAGVRTKATSLRHALPDRPRHQGRRWRVIAGRRSRGRSTIRVAPAERAPSVVVDIETDAQATRLLAISVYAAEPMKCSSSMPAALPCRRRRSRADDARRSMRSASACRTRSRRAHGLERGRLTVGAAANAQRHPFELGERGGYAACARLLRYGSASIPGRLALDGIDLIRGVRALRRGFRPTRWRVGAGRSAGADDAHDRIGEIWPTKMTPGFALWRARRRASPEIGEAEPDCMEVARQAHWHDA